MNSARWMRAALVAALTLPVLGHATAGPPGGPMGCVLREPGAPARFVAAGPRDRVAMRAAIEADRRTRQTQLVDACRLGQQRGISAAAYERLAARQPDRFAPLGPGLKARPPAPRAAKSPRYRYVDISAQTSGPDGFFFPAVTRGRAGLIGTIVRFNPDDTVTETVASYADGRLTPYAEGAAAVANASGLVGGSVLVDPIEFLLQGALFRPGQRELIPHPPDVASSDVVGLTDDGRALVRNLSSDFSREFLTMWDGRQHRPVDFGPEVPYAAYVAMNSRGQISGTTVRDGHYVGFRHDTRSGQTQILAPLPSEPEAFALGINTHGEVVGYSFVWGGIERVGTWDARGLFRERIVQGVPDRPTLSNWLAIGDTGLIAISRISNPPAERGRAYLLSRSGLRTDLATTTSGWPAALEAGRITDIDDLGNLLGFGIDPNSPTYGVDFLVERGGR